MTKTPARTSNLQSRAEMFAPPSKSAVFPNLGMALENHLLAALPPTEFRRLESKFEFVTCELNQILYQPNKKIDYAYFPTTAIVAMLCVMENGATTLTSVIGNDGIVGIASLLGVENAPHEAIVQRAGKAFRINQLDLSKEFRRGGVFQTLLLRFTMAMFVQTAQIAACNRLHSIEMQLCRWLLLTHDRLETNDFQMTHETISKMLGVSREGITLALKKLKKRKLVANLRGSITILNRQGLEANVCECYRRVNDEYNRLLGRGISRTFS